MIFKKNDEDVEMDMPTPCQHCGEIFELHDGCGSTKWYPNTVICEKCSDEEDKEIELDEEITELKEAIDTATYDIAEANDIISEAEKIIKESRERLKEIGIKD